MSTSSDLSSLIVVLVRPRNPLNIGAAARAMSNFGAEMLRCVNPYAVGFREARSAVGASSLLKNAEEFQTVAEAVRDCSLVVGTTAVRNRALHHQVRTLDQQSGALIRSHLKTGRVALLFGSEKIGLTNDDFSHCHWLLTIPTQETHISMNLGQAVAVCLYELAGSNRAEEFRQEKHEPASAGELEKISDGLYESLKMSGYVKPGNDAVSEKKVRRLMLRLNLDAMDAKVFLGMIRQIVWKLRQIGKLSD
ncbi:MAG TPA: TrmJ/YjtD family RNA methyltransferase [Candidatus Sulfotelmatobacter sp.]|nr:TrmJ/YjtD family RNA methyltransferase [Candidatus Sulfotelmatobacter sp.]